jgi:hypothetical protein
MLRRVIPAILPRTPPKIAAKFADAACVAAAAIAPTSTGGVGLAVDVRLDDIDDVIETEGDPEGLGGEVVEGVAPKDKDGVGVCELVGVGVWVSVEEIVGVTEGVELCDDPNDTDGVGVAVRVFVALAVFVGAAASEKDELVVVYGVVAPGLSILIVAEY